MRKQVSMALICLASQSAAAGTIYKCQEGGRISYHDRPCGQAAVALHVQATPAPAPEALQRLARERAMLQEIEAAREERAAHERARAERAERVERAAATLRRRCARLRLQRKWADEDAARAARAGGEGAERARTRAKRQAEALAVECPA